MPDSLKPRPWPSHRAHSFAQQANHSTAISTKFGARLVTRVVVHTHAQDALNHRPWLTCGWQCDAAPLRTWTTRPTMRACSRPPRTSSPACTSRQDAPTAWDCRTRETPRHRSQRRGHHGHRRAPSEPAAPLPDRTLRSTRPPPPLAFLLTRHFSGSPLASSASPLASSTSPPAQSTATANFAAPWLHSHLCSPLSSSPGSAALRSDAKIASASQNEIGAAARAHSGEVVGEDDNSSRNMGGAMAETTNQRLRPQLSTTGHVPSIPRTPSCRLPLHFIRHSHSAWAR
jgi:hypothetical protein